MKKEFKVEGVEKLNPNGLGGMCSRAVSFKSSEKSFEKGIVTIATTEAPAEVIDWDRWQVVREILPMRYMESPKNDKVPFLDSHMRGSLEKVKGSAKEFTIDVDKLMCKVFISESEVDIRQKINEGHIDSVSIGYMTDRDFTVEIPKGASVNIDGVFYRNEYADNVPLVVRTWWQTIELSGVAIGADDAAKFKSLAEVDNKKLLARVAELMEENNQLKSKSKESNQGERGLTYYEAQVRLLKYL